MTKLTTFLLSFFACIGVSNAQVTVYSQNFNSGSASEFTLNTTDVGGDNSMSLNYWIINDSYAGASLIGDTPDEPTGTTGITGAPESYYLHITSAFGTSLGADNCSFQTSSGSHSYFAAMNTAIVTTGKTNVNISFWWICKGNASAFGQLYYRTSASGSWIQVGSTGTTPVALDSYNNHNTWQQVTGIHMAEFDNQAYLAFGFRFKHGGSGMDPAFGVDEIKVVGTPAASITPSFSMDHSAVCQDSCITFTNTSTGGTADSVHWMVVGVPVVTNVSPLVQCFPSTLVPAGTYAMRMYTFSGGVEDSVTMPFTINPSPHPVATKVGHVLTVPAVYTSYQWYNGATAITGATNNTYTYTTSGVYKVIVDSGGCKGISAIFNTTGVSIVNGTNNGYWIAQHGDNNVDLNALQPTDEALAVTVYDATGRKAMEDTWNAGSSSKQVNTATLPSGLYIIKLSSSNTSVVLKWMK